MCGRFTSNKKKETIEKVKIDGGDTVAPRYNIAPTQLISAVTETENARQISLFKWGLVPRWAKDESIGNRLITARAETLEEKPSFREAFLRRQCIIPALGFYEWQKPVKAAKQPFYFYLKDKEIFGFAGLSEEWLIREIGELLVSCTIITIEANEVLKPVHERMPVILKPESYEQGLDSKEKNTTRLQKLLAPYPANEMSAHAVSRSVNITTNDSAELVMPVNSA